MKHSLSQEQRGRDGACAAILPNPPGFPNGPEPISPPVEPGGGSYHPHTSNAEITQLGTLPVGQTDAFLKPQPNKTADNLKTSLKGSCLTEVLPSAPVSDPPAFPILLPLALTRIC